MATMRFNFPYLERGRRAPDPERVLRETWLAAFDAATERAEGQAVLAGGKSLGGRIASMCAADGMPAAGLACSSGTRCTRRARPTSRARITSSGSRSRCCSCRGPGIRSRTLELLAKVIAKLGNRAVFEPVEGGDRSFRIRGVKADDREIGAALAGTAAPFVRRVAGER